MKRILYFLQSWRTPIAKLSSSSNELRNLVLAYSNEGWIAFWINNKNLRSLPVDTLHDDRRHMPVDISEDFLEVF